MEENKPLEIPELPKTEGTVNSTTTITAKPKPNGLLVAVLVVLGLLVVLGGTYAFLKTQKRIPPKDKVVVDNSVVGEDNDEKVQEGEDKKKESDKKNDVEDTGEVESKDSFAANKIFYIKDNNVFSYDIVTKETVQWTSYDRNAHNIAVVGVIDGKSLAFSKCSTVVGDYACGLFTINLDSKAIVERKKLGKQDMLLASGFGTETKFAYLFMKGENKWVLSLYDGGSEKVLEEVTVGEAYGRGGFIEDSEEIAFSPDQKYLFHISTGSPRGVIDFSIYVYNLGLGTKDIIKNATQPKWLDKDYIVYRKYDKDAKKGDGLYVYDVKTKTSEKISGLVDSSYVPNVLSGTKKIVYNVQPERQIWLVDNATGKNTKLLDSAMEPIWVNKGNIAFRSVKKCTDDCEGMYDYNILGVGVFDLETNTSVIIPGLKEVGPIVTEYK